MKAKDIIVRTIGVKSFTGKIVEGTLADLDVTESVISIGVVNAQGDVLEVCIDRTKPNIFIVRTPIVATLAVRPTGGQNTLEIEIENRQNAPHVDKQ